ncbi:TIGR00180 family glycosyltransferase [Pseudomonas japonica]|uniref:Glycosyltransferase domain-containing protein n=1 Tax=Pseudomonas japonica TaxID=256466 RepID=A0A239DK70_9PSED|nr:TIGR00180 family glycosyltransferase [Pseudomonas japonica]SNS32258.1 glycosyltransferase domain-containing protein [Pseudomonas japonica]
MPSPILNTQFTLVMLTHKRPGFLRRALQYYKDFPGTLLVLDSSPEPAAGVAERFPRVDYRHLPQFDYQGFQAKIQYGLGLVTTPYMAMVADDDFILPQAIAESLDFLEAHPDYGICQGYSMMYLAEAGHINYYRRDKKLGQEDYASDDPRQRILDYLYAFIPPFYAVTRTALLQDWIAQIPPKLRFEWLEISHVWFLLASAKARLLPIPYALREANYGASEHNTEVTYALALPDPVSVASREEFTEVLAGLDTPLKGEREQLRAFARQSFALTYEGLAGGRSLTIEAIFSSVVNGPGEAPTRSFLPTQYVDLPFYNQAFFERLDEIEFLLHAMPAGRLQQEKLEPLWLQQERLLAERGDDHAHSRIVRARHALEIAPYNLKVVRHLAELLHDNGETEEADKLRGWARRLEAVASDGGRALLSAQPSGRLLDWLETRQPEQSVREAVSAHLGQHQGGPQIGILLLNLEHDEAKLQATFDSLLGGVSRSFRIVVFTTGALPAMTTLQQTLHFVRVSKDDYVDKINQIARQMSCDWLMLAEAGDEFTSTGLLRAGLELLDAPDCRAVAVDEIQQLGGGAWREVLRPGINLDLLQSLPVLMARHWLVRREVLLEAGGFASEFSDALEYELLLRLIEKGGLNGLAHLDEPLLISPAPELKHNEHARQALARHLSGRGYKAQVSSAQPGALRVDYRHLERPQVSIILRSEDNQQALQRCLESILQRTRYMRYEVLIADNASQSPQHLQWLEQLQKLGGRVRVLQSPQRLSGAALINAASAEVGGEYLVLLAADAEVVNANWLELLLNQAQRPEVGVVGAKLVDEHGKVTQGGLMLGADGVRAAHVGLAKGETGYLGQAGVEQNYPAVSAACLMVRSEVFRALGGLDEEAFADSYADVDLCLKVADAGLLTVWTPQVQVIHPGLLPDDAVALAALRQKWSGLWHSAAHDRSLTPANAAFDWKALIG